MLIVHGVKSAPMGSDGVVKVVSLFLYVHMFLVGLVGRE